MIFGEKNKFALECQLEDESTDFFNCFICFWVGGMQIGNYERGGTLKRLSWFCENKLHKVSYYNEELAHKTADEVFEIIWQALYATDNETMPLDEINQNREYYYQFDICTDAAPAFDGYKVILINCPIVQRFIWRDLEKQATHEIKLPLGSYEEVITDFLKWSRKILQISE